MIMGMLESEALVLSLFASQVVQFAVVNEGLGRLTTLVEVRLLRIQIVSTVVHSLTIPQEIS